MDEPMNRGASSVKAKVGRLEASVSNLEADVAVLKTDVAVLKTDVAVLKTDVAVLKTDVAVLKTDVAELKTEFSGFRSETRVSMDDLRSMFHRTMVQVAGMVGDIAEMKRTMATKDDISRLNGRMDRFADMLDDSRIDQLKHKSRLDDHELRITGLEDGRS